MYIIRDIPFCFSGYKALFENRYTLKETNLLPVRAHYFISERIRFQKKGKTI